MMLMSGKRAAKLAAIALAAVCLCQCQAGTTAGTIGSRQTPSESCSSACKPGEILLTRGTDETINSAIASLPASGGRIVLGKSTFIIAKPIIIDRDGIRLAGQGRGTLLRLQNRADCPVIIIGSTATPPARKVRNVRVEHLVIDGNREAQTTECYGGICDTGGRAYIRNNAITVRAAEDIMLRDLVTRRARSGGVVLEKNCRRVTIDGLESHDHHFDGLGAYETEDSAFSKLNLHHNQSAGLSLDIRFNRNAIEDSIFADNGSQGIFMRDSNGNQFRRLQIRGNGAQGIFIAQVDDKESTASRDNRFAQLEIIRNRDAGIRINDPSCTGNALEASQVEGNLRGEISLAPGAGMMLR